MWIISNQTQYKSKKSNQTPTKLEEKHSNSNNL